MSEPRVSVVVFDLGGVLVDWNPRYLYRELFAGDEAAMEAFLSQVCTPDWNLQQDAGRPFARACALLTREFPQHQERIEAWLPGFDRMMAGAIEGTVELLAQLRERGTPLYALSNWSAETFPFALARFEFLSWFRGIVISGELGLVKPDPRIYNHLLERYGVRPEQAVFIDDVAHNVAGAVAVGMRGLLFGSPGALREELTALGLL